jgi:DNA-binding response OmpR family regulator
MMKKGKILLLEDDDILGTTIADILRSAGYEIDFVKDGEEAIDYTFDKEYDLYIFDINVPKVDGFELLNSLRDAGDDTPTIYITALTDLNSITKGFEAGADDYLKKPFLPEELLIRVDAKINGKNRDTIKYGNIEYHPLTSEIYLDGKIISLGSVQMKIFNLLMQNIGKITPKELLLDVMDNGSDTALRVAIAKLKQKLGIDIVNVRGLGYTIEKV